MEQKKQLPKKQLALKLSTLKIPQSPRLQLEQYPVSPNVASELLYMAGFEHRELEGNVIDLGTGTGRLAIGAALMGAERVVGIDVDEKLIELARENAQSVGVNVQWIASDISRVEGRFDTVIMNPPYGTRTSHADTNFLKKSFDLAPVVYSIHKASTRKFLFEFVEKSRREVLEVREMTLQIPHLFSFHRQKWRDVNVDIYRIGS